MTLKPWQNGSTISIWYQILINGFQDQILGFQDQNFDFHYENVVIKNLAEAKILK